MSVLKNKRTESKVRYITVAREIYTRTLNFLSRLSARYSRLVASDIAHMAYNTVVHCESANSIYPSDSARLELRKKHLLEARAKLSALDGFLGLCYEAMSLNPGRCFVTANGKPLKASVAKARLDSLSQTLGELIDEEDRLLTAVLKTCNEVKGKEETE